MRRDEIIIDQGFIDALPPLTKDERTTLRENIMKDGGILAPVVVWQEEKICLDGHNRIEIYDQLIDEGVLGLIFPAPKLLSFGSRDEALGWVRNHALGTRSLGDEWRQILIGQEYNATKKDKEGNLKQNAPKGQADPSERVSEVVAKKYGISEKTVRRYGKKAEVYDAAVKKHGKNSEEALDAIRGKKQPAKRRKNPNHDKKAFLERDWLKEVNESRVKCKEMVVARLEQVIKVHAAESGEDGSWYDYVERRTEYKSGSIKRCGYVLRYGCDQLIKRVEDCEIALTKARKIALGRTHDEQRKEMLHTRTRVRTDLGDDIQHMLVKMMDEKWGLLQVHPDAMDSNTAIVLDESRRKELSQIAARLAEFCLEVQQRIEETTTCLPMTIEQSNFSTGVESSLSTSTPSNTPNCTKIGA